MNNSSNNPNYQEYKEALKCSREEENHEISWIGHRLGWMLVSQSFLITAAIMAQSNDYPKLYGCFTSTILGILGVWLSLRSIIAIEAAQTVITYGWLAHEHYLCEEAKRIACNLDLYRIKRPLCEGKTQGDHLHEEAIKLHLQIGWTFITTWIAIYTLSIISASATFADNKSTYPEEISWVIVIIGIVLLCILLIVFFCHFKGSFKKLTESKESLKKSMESNRKEIKQINEMNNLSIDPGIGGLEFERFKLLREEIRFEYTSTSARVSLYFVSQVFLISSFVFSYGSQQKDTLKWFWEVILMIGIITSFFVFIVAFISILHVIYYQKKIDEIASENKKSLPFKKHDFLRYLADSYLVLMPSVFFFAWLYILIKSS